MAATLTLLDIIPPQPATQRNCTAHLSFDRQLQAVAYPCGTSAFIRRVAAAREADAAAAAAAAGTLLPDVVQFTGHGPCAVTVVKCSPLPGSHYVASGDESGRVIVWSWDVEGDGEAVVTKVQSEFQVLSGAAVTDIAWDFEARRLCVVGDGRDRFGAFVSWDSGNSLGEVAGHSMKINACAMRASRPMRAATVGDDGAVVFYRGPPFKFASSDRSHHAQGKFVRDVKFQPGAKSDVFVTVGSDRRICCFDAQTGDFIKFIADERHPVAGGIFALDWLDERLFATASADGVVRVWDVQDSKCVQHWDLAQSSDAKDGVAHQQVGIVAADATTLISLSLNGDLNVLTLGGSSEDSRVIRGHNKGITALAVNPLVTGSYDGRVVDWNQGPSASASSPDKVHQNKVHHNHTNLIVSIDNHRYPCVSTVSWDDTLQVNGETKLRFPAQPRFASVHDNVTAVVTSDNELLLLDNEKAGTVVDSLALDRDVSSVTVSTNYVAVGYQQAYDVEVFALDDLANRHTLHSAMKAAPSCISISPSEQLVAVGDVMGKIVLFDMASRDVKTSRWAFHTGRINAIEWQPQAQEEDLVATASLDTNVMVYSVKRPMRVVKRLNAHKDGVSCVKWASADTLVTAGADACVKTWRLD